jgi:adenylylsulfate kinase
MSIINTLKDQSSRTRSLAKALTWRITSTLMTAGIVYVVTGELKTAAIIGGIEFIIKFIIYYSHERAWNWVR